MGFQCGSELAREGAGSGNDVLADRVHIRCCGNGCLGFRAYGGSPFPNAEKVTQKALPQRSAHSLKLGVPSLRDPSGRIASGLLRCTSSRCIWLRQTVAALPPPDKSRNEAFRRRPWIKIKIKSCSRANAHPVEWGGFAAWVVSTLKLWERACSRRRPASRPIPN